MALVQITLDIPDEVLERVRAHAAEADIPDDLWEEAEEAVMDSIRATFSPMLLLGGD